MSGQCVVAEFDSLQRARTALQVLAKSDYHEEHVSFVVRGDDPELNLLQQISEESEDTVESRAGAGAGGLLGGALAVPLAAGTMIGPFILIGPLVAVGIASALGSFLGISKELGVDDDDLPLNYKDCIEQGGAVILGTGRDSEIRDMEALLKTADPVSLKRFTLPSPKKE